MQRLTISLTKAMYQHVSMLAVENNASLSKTINQLLNVGVQNWNSKFEPNHIEQHCQQLIIQINALVKNLAVEILKFNHEDFERLRQAAIVKFNEFT